MIILPHVRQHQGFCVVLDRCILMRLDRIIEPLLSLSCWHDVHMHGIVHKMRKSTRNPWKSAAVPREIAHRPFTSPTNSAGGPVKPRRNT